jgi:hypothetical protein
MPNCTPAAGQQGSSMHRSDYVEVLCTHGITTVGYKQQSFEFIHAGMLKA